jgi:SAM-dependent methyltransferase
LIHEENSISSFVEHETVSPSVEKAFWLKRFLRTLTPQISKNIKVKENFKKFTELLLQQHDHLTVLVIGAGMERQDINRIPPNPSLTLIHADLSFHLRIDIVCDSHDLPFADLSIDGVVVQAVLEHVLDPQRCVQEIHRVLKEDGCVYAETPFMQQVHMGRLDFTRFTHLGHRRLFREFQEIESGAVCGPGMALAWAYQYFLLSFVRTSFWRKVAIKIAQMTSFWLKWFDRYLIETPGTMDAASAYYFLGRKSGRALSDRELLQQYRGAQQ